MGIGDSDVKEPPVMWETWVQSLGWEDPLEKGMATTPVFWPGEFHGLYSPWGGKESDMTEQLSLSKIRECITIFSFMSNFPVRDGPTKGRDSVSIVL